MPICPSTSTTFRTGELRALRGPAHRRPEHPGPHQDVAQGTGRGAGWDGGRRMSGGKSSTCGTPQGGVASPLLANLYMNRSPEHWRRRSTGRAHSGTIIRQLRRRLRHPQSWRATEANGRGRSDVTDAARAHRSTRRRPRIRECPEERFDFLAATDRAPSIGRTATGTSARARRGKACKRFKEQGQATCSCPATNGHGPRCAISSTAMLRGWSGVLRLRHPVARRIEPSTPTSTSACALPRHADAQGAKRRGTRHFPHLACSGSWGCSP